MPLDVIFSGVLGLAVLLGIAGAVLWGIMTVVRALFGRDRRLERELGHEVIRDRLRRGEITEAEYEQAKRALGVK